MLYLCTHPNDFVTSTAEVLSNIKKYSDYFQNKKEQICFILSQDADKILQENAGLEEYNYLYASSNNIYQNLVEIRTELLADSLVVEDLRVDPELSISFYKQALLVRTKADFLRLQIGDHIDGTYFITQKLINKLWALTYTESLRASDFSWQSLPLDECINSATYTKAISTDVNL